jgi:putative glutamine amidotransferase
MPPLIGVTAGHRDVTSPGADERALVLYVAYTRMVRLAGGVAVIPAPVPNDQVPALLDHLDGVVLTGGGDVEPGRYGGATHDKVYGVDPERDEFEIAVAREAARRRMPMLAICRGMQVLNVAAGGTLIEDIADHRPDALPHRVEGDDAYRGIQEVDIQPGSTTALAVGATSLRVNSVHHQGIGEIAPAFRVTATTGDGIIEAFEPRDEAWPLWAVQWHPEWLPDEEASGRLFRAVVDAAS